MRRPVALSGLAFLLTLTACATTVPYTRTVASGSLDGTDGTSVDGSGGSSADPGATDAGTVAGAAGTTDGAQGAAGATGSSKAGTATKGSTSKGAAASASAAGNSARGVSASTLTLGFPVATGQAALASSFGVSGAGSTSESDIINAVVADVNATGGIAGGRKLAVNIDPFDSTNAVANEQATIADICAHYRDDVKVFAVVFDTPDPSLRSCLADMGSPLVILNSYALVTAAAFQESGSNYLYGPNSISDDRLAQLFIQSLQARTFTTPWNTSTGSASTTPAVNPVKLGVIHVDTPDQDALYADYAKELAKVGLSFTDTVTYSQDAATALSSTQSAVLKFSTDGITHVFGASAFFLDDADTQGYKPRYAYLPGLGALGVENVPADQLNGALTVGWSPTTDVNTAQNPADTAADAKCRAVMTAAGLSTADQADLSVMYAVCDSIYSVRAALAKSGTVSVAGLRQGYEQLGTSFAPANTFATTISATDHSGVQSVRDMDFNNACGCLEYSSSTNRS